MRRALMKVSFSLLELVIKGQWSGECIRTTAPDDVRVVGVEHGPAVLSPWLFFVVLESSEFPETLPGQPLPILDPFEYEVRP